MEFKFDENSAVRNDAFLNKTKNQAKNLLKLAKKNQLNIQIDNLSKAQEVLAQINGFPNWHALEKTIKTPSIDNRHIINTQKNDSNNNFIHMNSILDNVAYLTEENSTKVVSFIKLNNLPQMELQTLNEFIGELIKKTAFDFNMGFYKINILINNEKITKKITYENKNIGFHNAQNMDQKLFNEIFTIDLNNTDMYKNYSESFQEEQNNYQQNVIISIETDKTMLLEHIQFCKLLTQERFTYYFEILNKIKEHDYNNFLKFYDQNSLMLENSIVPTSNIEDLIEVNANREINYTKFLYAIQTLVEKGNFSLNICLTTGNIYQYNPNNKIDHNFSNNAFIKGLFKTLKISEFNKKFIPNFEIENGMQDKSSLNIPFGMPLYNITDKAVGYYQPISSNQSTWITLVFGKPGSGKSILLNALNIATTFMPGINQLPTVGVLDIGPSSKSMIELLQNTLPQYKDKIKYHLLENNDKYIINPFDTVLGSRYPNEEQLNYLINFVSLLASEYSDQEILVIKSLSKAVIEETYNNNIFKPKIYYHGVLPNVDNKLNELDIILDEITSWWQIVDILFDNNEIELATLAQRYAVPILADLPYICQREKIRNIYSRAQVVSGERLIDYFNRNITQSLINYPILKSPTNFDIRETDINVIDLDKVAKSGSGQAQKQTSVMYMIGRYLFNSKKHYKFDIIPQHINTDGLNLNSKIIKKYNQYHKSVNDILKEKAISISYDEFHRANHYIVKEQIEHDIRSARIESVAITLISQSIDDFSQPMIDFATSVFILDSPSLNSMKEMEQFSRFNFFEEEKLQIQNVHGPRTNRPGVFFLKSITNRGKISKSCSLELPILLKVALTTNSEDSYIRNKLVEKLGYLQALKVMKKLLPISSKKIIEKMKEEDKRLGKYVFNEDNDANYYDKLFNEIMEKIENISVI